MNRVLNSRICWHGSWSNDKNPVCKKAKGPDAIECSFCEDICGWSKIHCEICSAPTSQCFTVLCHGVNRYKCDIGPYPYWIICVSCFQPIKQELINRRLDILKLTKSTHEAMYHWINMNWDEFNV